MLNTEIIARFRLQVDDATELSSDEELALEQEVYDEVCNDRPWEFLKKTKTDTTSTSVPYVALPADFKMIALNSENESIVFVGTNYDKYKVVPFSSRRDYRDMDGYCYVDKTTSRLYFTLQPTSAKSIEYDYIHIPTELTLGSTLITNEPIVRTTSFGNLLALGMAAKFNPIEQSEKQSSYRAENLADYRAKLEDLAVEDAYIKLAVN